MNNTHTNTAEAILSNLRHSPRKVRVVANLVRGKRVEDVLVSLDFVNKKASQTIKTLIASAYANAKSLDIPIENMVVQSIEVNGGKILYRRRPAARGSAHPIRKRTSSIKVVLGPKIGNMLKKDKKAMALAQEIAKADTSETISKNIEKAPKPKTAKKDPKTSTKSKDKTK